MTDLALAVDVGGTKMAAGLVERRGELRYRAQVPTSQVGTAGSDPQEGGPDGDLHPAEVLWRTLVDLVDGVHAYVGPDDRLMVCGVGCGGPMSPQGDAVSPLNIAGWRAFPLRTRLSDHTGLPTYVDNDAKALARAEGGVGAAAGFDDFIAMVVSTGVGGGLFLNGRLLSGRLGNAGHIGHVVVEPEGRVCACGGRGCLEAEASGSSIAAVTGRPAQYASAETKSRTGTLVGRAVASVVNLLDLPMAVVSGSVALGFGEPFFAAAQREVDARCRLEFSRGAQIVPGGLGDRGPLIGAGMVGWNGWETVG